MSYVIRQTTRSELETVIGWAADEGWNPGLNDGGTFYATDPAGYLVGELDGEIIASISSVAYPNDFGFIGFYIVKPEYRGKGYGLQLWQAGIAQLKGHNIGLDGVSDQEDNYKKSGFQRAYSNIRYSAVSTGYKNGESISQDLPVTQILAYDDNFFPAPRHVFLEHWLRQEGSKVRVRVVNDVIKGYGVIRPCRQGFKIGPLFAETEEDADAIFRDLANEAVGQIIYLDAPEPNTAALTLSARYQMEPVFKTCRMYTRATPPLPLTKIYGNTTFELG